MPTRNRTVSLERAIESVLDQSYEFLELIIVDDASDDTTPDLLTSCTGRDNIIAIRNTEPKGAAASRNLAVQHAAGEFVTGIDDDDYWRPNRIEELINEWSEGQYAGICSNDRMDFGEKEIVWKKKSLITLNDLLYYNMVGNQVLTRKSYFLELGGYDERLPSAQDYDLWIRLAHDYGPIKNVPKTTQVVNMREDEDRITTSDKQIEGYFQCFEKHQAKMNASQKRYQKYRMKLASGEDSGWLEMFRSVPSNLLVKEITRKLFL
jgi:glycosyltransferase involved in cell wall biosynthesis